MEAKHDEAQADQKNKEKEAEVKDENKEKKIEIRGEVVPVDPQDVGGQKRDTEAATAEEGANRQKTRTDPIVADETQKRGADEDPEENAGRKRAKTQTRFDESSDKRERVATEEGQASTRVKTKNRFDERSDKREGSMIEDGQVNKVPGSRQHAMDGWNYRIMFPHPRRRVQLRRQH